LLKLFNLLSLILDQLLVLFCRSLKVRDEFPLLLRQAYPSSVLIQVLPGIAAAVEVRNQFGHALKLVFQEGDLCALRFDGLCQILRLLSQALLLLYEVFVVVLPGNTRTSIGLAMLGLLQSR
jgi:hypothetical protein